MSYTNDRHLDQQRPPLRNRPELRADVESEVRPSLAHERERHEGFLTRMAKAPFRIVAAPFKFAWKHPVVTALGVTAAALWGVPWLARQVGNVEGGLSSVPLNRMLAHFRRGATPLGDTMPPTPMLERPELGFR